MKPRKPFGEWEVWTVLGAMVGATFAALFLAHCVANVADWIVR